MCICQNTQLHIAFDASTTVQTRAFLCFSLFRSSHSSNYLAPKSPTILLNDCEMAYFIEAIIELHWFCILDSSVQCSSLLLWLLDNGITNWLIGFCEEKKMIKNCDTNVLLVNISWHFVQMEIFLFCFCNEEFEQFSCRKICIDVSLTNSPESDKNRRRRAITL